MRIKETSHISIRLDGEEVLDYHPQSITDAIEKAVNIALERGRRVVIQQKIEIEPVE